MSNDMVLAVSPREVGVWFANQCRDRSLGNAMEGERRMGRAWRSAGTGWDFRIALRGVSRDA